MITNIYLNDDRYSTIAESPRAKEVFVKLPKNWTIELNGYGDRTLLDQCGNARQLITLYRYGRPVPSTIDNYGYRQNISLAA